MNTVLPLTPAEQATCSAQVRMALAEDVGPGDRTAALIPANVMAHATVLVRENACLCGQPWFNEVFLQCDKKVECVWTESEGASLQAGQTVVSLVGPARALLTGERSALNFLQSLSAVATQTALFVKAVEGTRAVIVDTRKTIPGLRLAQKYAVRAGGGRNHRIGLYDGLLLKENHIAAAGGVRAALVAALAITPKDVLLEIEVETLQQLEEALQAGAPMVLLDNMTTDQLREAVYMNQGRTILEASGGVNVNTVRAIAETGVDRISVGGLTKDIKAIDFSMRFQIDE
jgi:nicotinate-nucleotide pyrophosphorylase (carboxylating)